MIISDKHKYVFIELPRTGSTAIANELREQYDGIPILYKHATYEEFLRDATPEQREYFSFSGIRNPLDDVVSVYAKYAQDPRKLYRDPEKLKVQSRNLLERIRDRRRVRFIERGNAEFADFFLKFYRFPYSRWSELSHTSFDFLIHFERLQEDFSEALTLIGIEPRRPLPERNRTGGKANDYLSYYTPETIARAKWVFGPYMKKWGYAFPEEWGEVNVSWWNQLEFRLVNNLKGTYWKYLRPQLAKLRSMAHQGV
ncbi:hypothetical protein DFR30_1442 [Thiogranum longum]|uniref:Sulfotransferase family protein n=1 Tax=Thiogranum longum TaxID=1537524 RepID=A0A4R1HC39_9GAMM|nr:sulfotransferase family 2 domain-containing protein [Thiogranum longum]TCK18171.1 hypothetical protein DFR30_1442 [Thiogranum longum]